MHYKLLYPSEYLCAADLQGKAVTVEIESVKVEELQSADGHEDQKPVIRFTGKAKRLVMNKTNAKSIAAIHGNDTDGWAGKKIILHPTTCEAFGETVECIRVKK